MYISDAVSVQPCYYFHKNYNGLLIGGVIGGSVFIPTGKRNDEVEIFARYGVSAGYENQDLRIVAELIGILISTENRILSDGKSEHFITLGGQWTGGSVLKPKMNIHIPLGNDLSEIYGSALTIGCDFVLP